MGNDRSLRIARVSDFDSRRSVNTCKWGKKTNTLPGAFSKLLSPADKRRRGGAVNQIPHHLRGTFLDGLSEYVAQEEGQPDYPVRVQVRDYFSCS